MAEIAYRKLKCPYCGWVFPVRISYDIFGKPLVSEGERISGVCPRCFEYVTGKGEKI